MEFRGRKARRILRTIWSLPRRTIPPVLKWIGGIEVICVTSSSLAYWPCAQHFECQYRWEPWYACSERSYDWLGC